ncbi:hypothetical protein EPA93_22840 [Ktedonosporobacter rubrisoli]|uniref:Uncharacterized protein n=1 Tax=Ktedonosporobacter rubrisoli TaxID=2509675 RepID=A0A4P6JSY2_KTERU|nr:hypothetical protein [Ktedonosporobacter rubrisoli]QBD78668.1 hypothetical protein EPA93_22840 [Ktedonosporobacter rubrisoli]
MNKEMLIIYLVNRYAEGFYEDAVALGCHAAKVVGEKHRSQMTGLENIANSALKYTDVLDYIKRQTARFDYWRKGYEYAANPDIGFGKRLLDYLSDSLQGKRDGICRNAELQKAVPDEEEMEQVRRRVYILLIRQFIRQMVIQYEFNVQKWERS